MAFGFYSDPALTTAASSLAIVTMLESGTAAPASAVVYFGSTDAAVVAYPASGSSIEIAVTDSVSGSGLPASAIKLATSEAGLAGAVAGDPLALGATVPGGVENALQIWIQADTGAAAAGLYADLALQSSSMIEVPA